MQRDLAWFCSQRRDESIGISRVACVGLSQLDRGLQVGGILLLHFSGGPLLGGFPVRVRLFSGGSRLRFVDGIDESPVEVVM